jgi:hypothetical protein
MEIDNLLAIFAGLAGGSAATWLAMRYRRLAERIAELERAQTPPTPAWAESMKLDHRAQLISVAALVQLSLRDQLDALMRLSPEMAREEIERVAPQLFKREGIQ